MKKEVKKLSRLSIMIIITIIIIIIIISIVFYTLRSRNKEPVMDLSMESGIKNIIIDEINFQNKSGIVISIINVDAYRLSNGQTKCSAILLCDDLMTADMEVNIFERIATKLMEVYPDKFNRDSGNSWIDIECKYKNRLRGSE